MGRTLRLVQSRTLTIVHVQLLRAKAHVCRGTRSAFDNWADICRLRRKQAGTRLAQTGLPRTFTTLIYLKADLRFDDLRTDPQFQDLARRGRSVTRTRKRLRYQLPCFKEGLTGYGYHSSCPRSFPRQRENWRCLPTEAGVAVTVHGTSRCASAGGVGLCHALVRSPDRAGRTNSMRQPHNCDLRSILWRTASLMPPDDHIAAARSIYGS
jgi:hypothetical protein